MKRALLCLAACLAFAIAGAAQSGTSGQDTSGQTPSKHHHKAGGDTGNSITGCVEKTDGGYAIKHGKKTVNVTGSDDLSAHVGHTVTLAGSWGEAAASGGDKSFNETGVTMVSETCGSMKHKKGSGSDTTTTPK